MVDRIPRVFAVAFLDHYSLIRAHDIDFASFQRHAYALERNAGRSEGFHRTGDVGLGKS
jgi:hypothetical protein